MEISIAWTGTQPPDELLLKAFDYAKKNDLNYEMVTTGNVGTLSVKEKEVFAELKTKDTIYYVFAPTMKRALTYVPQIKTHKANYKYISSSESIMGIDRTNSCVLITPNCYFRGDCSAIFDRIQTRNIDIKYIHEGEIWQDR